MTMYKGTEWCEGTNWFEGYRITAYAPCVKGARCMAILGRGVAVVVDPGSPSSSGAVIRKQPVVGCILFY